MNERAVIRRVNRREAHCSRCGTLVPPGSGRLWTCACPGHCSAPDFCVPGVGKYEGIGWHCSCLEEKECARRAGERREWPRMPAIAGLIRHDWTLPKELNITTAALVLKCRVVHFEGLFVEIEGPAFAIEELSHEPRYGALHAAVAACIVRSVEEHPGVEVLLTKSEEAVA